MLPSVWISDWFQILDQVICATFIVLQVPVRQHVSNDLEMPAKSRFKVPKMSNHSETSFMSSCFVFFQKKEAFNKSPIEIGPKLRCISMHSADMFHLAKL